MTASEIVDAIVKLAWPVVALICALMFRRPLTDLLKREHIEASVAGVTLTARNTREATNALIKAEADKNNPASADAAAKEVEDTSTTLSNLRRAPKILWVDDRPGNNRHEVQALEAMGMTVSLATSTVDALAALASTGPYDVIISDMGRPPDARAGYTLLDGLRQAGNPIPFVIYAGSNDAAHFNEAVHHGAIGSTNRPTDLIRLVRRAIASNSSRSD